MWKVQRMASIAQERIVHVSQVCQDQASSHELWTSVWGEGGIGFERIVDCLRPLWEKQIIAAYQARFRGSGFDTLAVLSQLQHSVFYRTAFGDQLFSGVSSDPAAWALISSGGPSSQKTHVESARGGVLNRWRDRTASRTAQAESKVLLFWEKEVSHA